MTTIGYLRAMLLTSTCHFALELDSEYRARLRCNIRDGRPKPTETENEGDA